MSEIKGLFEALGDDDWIRTSLSEGVSYLIRVVPEGGSEYPSLYGTVRTFGDSAFDTDTLGRWEYVYSDTGSDDNARQR